MRAAGAEPIEALVWVTESLSNRELAVAAWAVPFGMWVLTIPKGRASLARLIRSAIAWKLFVPAILLATYTGGVCYALSRVGLWEPAMLKDTILWFGASGLTLAYSFARSSQENWIRSVVLDQVRALILIEYLAAAFTFSFPVEFIFQPLMFGVGVVYAVSQTDARYRPATLLASATMIAAGILVVGNAAYQASHALAFTVDTAWLIALPIMLTIALIPAAYFLHLVVAYENLFLRLQLGGPRDKVVVRYAQRQLFKALRFSVVRIDRFLRADPMALSRVRSKHDVDELLRNYRHSLVVAS